MAAIIVVSSDGSECGSSSSSVVSLLDRLKSSTPADIGSARKLKTTRLLLANSIVSAALLPIPASSGYSRLSSVYASIMPAL